MEAKNISYYCGLEKCMQNSITTNNKHLKEKILPYFTPDVLQKERMPSEFNPLIYAPSASLEKKIFRYHQ